MNSNSNSNSNKNSNNVDDDDDDSLLLRSSFESAVEALYSPLHQAVTKDDIQQAAKRRTRTIEDMRYYWKKILKACNNNNNNNNNSTDGYNYYEVRRPMIHITGTKGKGSTACMCESIVRSAGCTTGLFTSPHLIDIRERIRIDGKPISKSLFAKVYWRLRDALEQPSPSPSPPPTDKEDDEVDEDPSITRDPPPTLPGYFRMVTLMAFYIFHEVVPVDVIVIEVGMGGRYDATNFLDAPHNLRQQHNHQQQDDHVESSLLVCGITLLDLDHCRILGNTLEEIAWEKGGIMAIHKLDKNRISPRPTNPPSESTSMTAPDSHETATANEPIERAIQMLDTKKDPSWPSRIFILSSNTVGVVQVMKGCARIEGVDSSLDIVDATGNDIRNLLTRNNQTMGLAGYHQYGNAALAVALCRSLVTRMASVTTTATTKRVQLDESAIAIGLATARWPARCQTVEHNPHVTLRLDGAHTYQSLSATMEWFWDTITQTVAGQRVLIFTCSHERNPIELLSLLRSSSSNCLSPWNSVYFCSTDFSKPSPLALPTVKELLHQADEAGLRKPGNAVSSFEETLEESMTLSWQERLGILWKYMTYDPTSSVDTSTTRIITTMSASQAIQDILSSQDPLSHDETNTTKIEVLVTGSLYLVGSVLSAIGWQEESSTIETTTGSMYLDVPQSKVN